MDDFFLPPERKTPARLAEPGGNVDRERFESEVLSHLGTSFSYRPWRCHPGAFAAPVSVEPRAVVIVEGVYSLHPQLRSAYDLRVFLSIAPEAQQARIRARSGEAMLSRLPDGVDTAGKHLLRPPGRARLLPARLRGGVTLCAAHTPRFVPVR